MVVERHAAVSLFKTRNSPNRQRAVSLSSGVFDNCVAEWDLVIGLYGFFSAQYFAFGSELQMKCLSASKLKAPGKHSSSGFPSPSRAAVRGLLFF